MRRVFRTFLRFALSPIGTLFYTVFSGGHIYTLTHLQQAWLSMCPNAVTP